MWKRNDQQADEDCNLDYFMEEVVIAGDPDHVASRINNLRQEVGEFGTLVLVAHDWDNREAWLRSLELFSREVMPQIR